MRDPFVVGRREAIVRRPPATVARPIGWSEPLEPCVRPRCGGRVPADGVQEVAALVRARGGDELADRLERAVADEVKLLALTLDERALMLSALDDPPQELGELRAVLLAQATELQRELIDLHGEITSAPVDLHQMADGMNASQRP